jgi:hypothetical protein
MGNGNTWRVVRMAFADPGDLRYLAGAEVGLTDRYLSFVTAPPTGERHRPVINVSCESGDGKQRREISGKVVRGLDGTTAQKVIALINSALAGSGARLVLQEVRRKIVGGKAVIVYERRDPRFPKPSNDSTPPPASQDSNSDVTAVNLRYADANMARRRSD